jgi:thiol-disulfide isomerase/thioredoxin
MKFIAKLFSILLVLVSPLGYGQGNPGKELSIGDTCPDLALNLVNHKYKKTTLRKIKRPLIILDFWTLSCSGCILSFPKLDSLQHRFDKKFQILLMNEMDSEERIVAFFEKRKTKLGVKYTMPSSFGDSIAKNLFKHRSIPHYVWLDSTLRIISITGPHEVTAQNIQSLLNGEEVSLPVKNDYGIDEDALFSNSGILNKARIKSQTTCTGFASGLVPHVRSFKNNLGYTYRRYWINYPIISMYKDAYKAYLPKSQILIEVKDIKRFQEDNTTGEWNIKDLYCFEMVNNSDESAHFDETLKVSLDQFFQLRARFEKRLVKSYVLTSKNLVALNISGGTEQSNNLRECSKHMKFVKNTTIPTFVSSLNQIMNIPIIDGTNYKGWVDMTFEPDVFRDITILKNALKKYGFDLIEEMREMDIFVITDKP